MSKLVSYIGMVVALGILVDLMTTTFELARVDKGLNSSLQSTSQLVSIEQAVTKKNAALPGVLKTTEQMNGQLKGIASTTAATRNNINLIASLNAGTLQLNIEQAAIASNSGKAIGAVIQDLAQLQKATSSLGKELASLDHVIQQDRANLDQMKSATATMNQKTPGV